MLVLCTSWVASGGVTYPAAHPLKCGCCSLQKGKDNSRHMPHLWAQALGRPQALVAGLYTTRYTRQAAPRPTACPLQPSQTVLTCTLP